MIKLLLDRSTDDIARVFDHAGKRIDGPLPSVLAGMVSRRKRPEPFVSEQRGAILELARLAAAGRARLYTSRIGFDEAFRVARWPDPADELDIFSNTKAKIEWAELPFNFTKVPGFYGNDVNDIDRYRRILKLVCQPEFVGEMMKNQTVRFSPQEQKRVQEIGKVLRLAGPNAEHLLDVFQLWTAQVAGIPYYVTCDRKFIRYMSLTMKNHFKSRPVLPSEVCTENNIPFHPLAPPQNDTFYALAERPLTRMIKAHDRRDPPPQAWGVGGDEFLAQWQRAKRDHAPLARISHTLVL